MEKRGVDEKEKVKEKAFCRDERRRTDNRRSKGEKLPKNGAKATRLVCWGADHSTSMCSPASTLQTFEGSNLNGDQM